VNRPHGTLSTPTERIAGIGLAGDWTAWDGGTRKVHHGHAGRDGVATARSGGVHEPLNTPAQTPRAAAWPFRQTLP